MKLHKFKIILALCATLILTQNSFAQSNSSNTSLNWRRGTAIVLFAGIGGGILGLSTLSFYGQPQEHTNNITIGGLAGTLAGLGYVFYKANNVPTNKATDFYSMSNMRPAQLKTDARPVFHIAFEF